MISHNKLDDMTFEQLVQQAKESIPELCAGWTDQNTHDPGIMLIELFAWLTEMQRFYLDNAIDVGYFFRLLHISPKRASPSTVCARVVSVSQCDEAFTLPMGTKVTADDVCFETDASYCVNVNRILGAQSEYADYDPKMPTTFAPFGNSAKPGARFDILLDKPFHPNSVGRINFLAADVKKVKRNPYSPALPLQFAKLVWEYFSCQGWVELEVTKDQTHQLLYNGALVFRVGVPMTPAPKGHYRIRCTVQESSYDLAPQLAGIQTEVLELTQRETLAEDISLPCTCNQLRAATHLAILDENMLFCVNGNEYTQLNPAHYKKQVQDGTAIFELSVDATDAGGSKGANDASGATDSIGSSDGSTNSWDSNGAIDVNLATELHLISHSTKFIHNRILGVADGFPGQSFTLDLHGEVIIYDSFEILISPDYAFKTAQRWTKTDVLSSAGPMDMVYILDENAGVVTFGDGFNGLMPKGVVMVSSMAVTKADRGNIQAGQLTELTYNNRRIVLEQNSHSQGGSGVENAKDALLRCDSSLERAATEKDYEYLVKQTPGLMIEAVRAFARSGVMQIAVKPYFIQHSPPFYKNQILAFLERFRLVGTEIVIVSPDYAVLYITVQVSSHPSRKNVKAVVKNEIKAFFEAEYSGFGARVLYNKLFAFIDSLDILDELLALSVRAEGINVETTPAGDIILPQGSLIVLGDILVL